MKTKTTLTRRVLALCMSVLMLMTAWVFVAPTKVAAAADVWDGTWDGSGFSNNHITSAKGFAQFINNAGTGTSYSGQTIYLDVDIDLQSINFGNGGGKNVYYDRNNYFQGTFDGQGHTISNFYMTNDDHRVGLFRSAQNATFKNVNFENAFVDDNNNNGKNGFAVLVGWGDGNLTFENVHLKSLRTQPVNDLAHSGCRTESKVCSARFFGINVHAGIALGRNRKEILFLLDQRDRFFGDFSGHS